MVVVGRRPIFQGSRRRVVEGSDRLEGVEVGWRSWDASLGAGTGRAFCTTIGEIRC